MNESEPLMRRRKNRDAVKTTWSLAWVGQGIAETYLLAMRQPAYRRHDFYLDSFMEGEKLCTDANGALLRKGNSRGAFH